MKLSRHRRPLPLCPVGASSHHSHYLRLASHPNARSLCPLSPPHCAPQVENGAFLSLFCTQSGDESTPFSRMLLGMVRRAVYARSVPLRGPAVHMAVTVQPSADPAAPAAAAAAANAPTEPAVPEVVDPETPRSTRTTRVGPLAPLSGNLGAAPRLQSPSKSAGNLLPAGVGSSQLRRPQLAASRGAAASRLRRPSNLQL